MSKRKRIYHILPNDPSPDQILKLIDQAYDEGYEDGFEDGKAEGTVTFPSYDRITVPLKDLQITPNSPSNPWNPSITPNDWPPSVIYCGTPPKTYFDETTGSPPTERGVTVSGDSISCKNSADQ